MPVDLPARNGASGIVGNDGDAAMTGNGISGSIGSIGAAVRCSSGATGANGGSGASFQFRRAQSLRFPRPSAGGFHSCQSPSASSAATAIGRTGSRNYRSKSSRHRFGSIEAQSLLGRLSAGQRLALVSTWRQMRNQQAQLCALMRKILAELEHSEPVVKEIFYKAGFVDCWEKAATGGTSNPATLDEHVRLMAKFFDDLVLSVEAAGPSGIEGGEEISAHIREMGQRHAILAHSSGLPADVWEKLGEIAMEKLCAMECVQRTREAGRAWRTLIAFWTDKIRCGFEDEAKAFSSHHRRPSTEVHYQPTLDGGVCEELTRKLQQLRTVTECDGVGSGACPAKGNVALHDIDDSTGCPN